MSGGGSLASALRKASASAQTFPRRLIQDSVNLLQKSAVKNLKADTGGDASLSHAPTTLAVKRTVKGHATVVEGRVEPALKGAAQWAWLERGTNAHAIGTGTHPGTRGKATWTKGIDPAVVKVNRLIDEAFDRVARF